MTNAFSKTVTAKSRQLPGFRNLQTIDMDDLGVFGAPVAVLDDFRVEGLPFSPHPHAGFAAVTYVFEDSVGSVRSRSSLGTDVVVGPGGIVWTHAGRGAVHEETPARPGTELHGLQLFVNLSARNKLSPPQVAQFESHEIPTWTNEYGDRARVVVGSYAGIDSPLVPIEPFTLLDVSLRRTVEVSLPNGYNAVIYVRSGSASVTSGGSGSTVGPSEAVALRGVTSTFTLGAAHPSELVVLAGPAIEEPMVFEGPFLMNNSQQVAAAIERYRRGEMGHVSPLD